MIIKNRILLIFLAGFLFIIIGHSQIDTIKSDTFSSILEKNTLLNKKKTGEIVPPYRAADNMEAYPANNLYNTWTSEFLTPYSFPKSNIPDTFSINLAGFNFPTDGKVTSNFGYRSPRQHYGIDLKISMKDTIRAAFAGKVRIERYEPRGYGYYIVIRHSNGLETIYGHLSKFLVKVNQYVTSGEPIALGGNSGRSTGPHLHFETRFLGNPLNPSDLIDFNNKSLLASTYTYVKDKKITRTAKK
ncbi:MAG: M23 family metallopeptidase [Bacteroidales bacterium]|nr:M23 family metallopeptidase [Bacteroidales bacterium]